jgi:hypothetical protein
MGPIADADEDLAAEHDDLLILSRVDVKRQTSTTSPRRAPPPTGPSPPS